VETTAVNTHNKIKAINMFHGRKAELPNIKPCDIRSYHCDTKR